MMTLQGRNMQLR